MKWLSCLLAALGYWENGEAGKPIIELRSSEPLQNNYYQVLLHLRAFR